MKIKMSIFIHILVSTLIPVLLVLIIVIGTVHSVIKMNAVSFANEYVKFAAEQISMQSTVKLEYASTLQTEIIQQIIQGYENKESIQEADNLLEKFILSDNNIYSVWFAFKDDVFGEYKQHYKMITRKDGKFIESNSKKENPSPWYIAACDEGLAYIDFNYTCDFGTGDGAINAFVMAYPIITKENDIIGALGLSIRYKDIFSIENLAWDESQKFLLLSEEGDVLYSSNETYAIKSLWDYKFLNKKAVSLALSEKDIWREEIKSHNDLEDFMICLYPVSIKNSEQFVYLCWEIPSKSLFQFFYTSMEVIVFTGVLGMILLALSVFFTTRNIAKNVKVVAANFNSIRENENITLQSLNIPTHQTNVIELDTLQTALVSMVAKLGRLQELKMEAVEAELEKERLIASSQAKTNFFAAMSHEIRTPMNAILGISEILLHEGGLSQEQERNVQDIKISTDSLLNIINDILDISKLESGKTILNQENYDFPAFMDNIVSIARQLANNANLKFIYKQSGNNFPPCLYGDKLRLRQVLLNLLGNAVKFTKTGSITFNVEIIKDENLIHFNVIDTGIGIDEKEIDSIFDTFKRIDTKRNRDIEGTGLGLSISKNLTELMGGTIKACSIYGEGSTFSLTIPYLAGDAEKIKMIKIHANMKYSDDLRILVVDDDRTNLNVSSGLLKAVYGIICDTAQSGEEAINKVQKTDYDIIFMDHMMPDMDGIETTHHIRNLGDKYKDVTIIALTANAISDAQKELIESGMNDFLAKPIQVEKLNEIFNIWVPEKKKQLVNNKDLSMIKINKNQISDKNKKIQFNNEKDNIILSDSDLQQLFENEGINVSAGMENIGNDEKMYLRSLKIFINSIPKFNQEMNEYLEKGEIKQFFIRIHAIKSSLLSIGISDLSGEAKNIEIIASGCNNNKTDNNDTNITNCINECTALFAPLSVKLKRLYQRLNHVFINKKSENEKNIHTSLNGEQIVKNLTELYTALNSFNYDAISDKFEIVLAIEYDVEMNEFIENLKKLISNYEYLEAAELIQNEIDV